MDEHQHQDHVHTYPGELGSPETVPHAVKVEPGEYTQSDGINVAEVATIGTFLAMSLLVLVLVLQAWFYHENDAEAKAKTLPQDDPAMPYGAMVQEHQHVLMTGESTDAKGVVHKGLPISAAPYAPPPWH